MKLRCQLLLSSLLFAAPALAQGTELPQYTNGTAFFITADGYLLTAAHVVKNCAGKPYINGRFIIDGQRLVAPEARLGAAASSVETTIEVKVVDADEGRDLALLKILPPLQVENTAIFRADTPPVATGENAIAIGYPVTSMEKLRLLDFQTQSGQVIAINAPGAPAETLMAGSNGKSLGTHGYSGGPVLDGAGNVIGMNLAVACLNKGCMEQVKQFRTLYGETPEASNLEPDDYQQKLESHLDSSIIADLASVRRFAGRNNITLAGSSTDASATPQKLQQNSYAIANVGCTAKMVP